MRPGARTLAAFATTSVLVVACAGDDGPGAAAFVIETAAAMPGAPTTFTATGAAVDQGLLCASGDAAWLRSLDAEDGQPLSEQTQDGDVIWVESRFTCEDGSGEFTLRAVATADDEELRAIVETGQDSAEHPLTWRGGTGNYSDIAVDGVRTWTVARAGSFDDGVRETFSGTLAAD